jgi:hypothetical protein
MIASLFMLSPFTIRLRLCGKFPCRLSDFETEMQRVAEIAVGESIQEAKCGDSIEAGRYALDADNANILVEPELRNLNADAEDRVQTGNRSLKLRELHKIPAAIRTILFQQDQFKAGTH